MTPRCLLALFAGLVALPAVAACEAEVADATGDTDPGGLPRFYDLAGLHIAFSGDTLVWSWDVSSLEGAHSVVYTGHFADAADRDSPFLPRCEFLSAATADSPTCYLLQARRVAATAGAFELLQALDPAVEGNRITVAIPFDAIGFTNDTRVVDAGSIVQMGASLRGPANGTATPHVTDEVEGLALAPCLAAESAEPPTPDQEASVDVPGIEATLLLAALTLVALDRRR